MNSLQRHILSTRYCIVTQKWIIAFVVNGHYEEAAESQLSRARITAHTRIQQIIGQQTRVQPRMTRGRTDTLQHLQLQAF